MSTPAQNTRQKSGSGKVSTQTVSEPLNENDNQNEELKSKQKETLARSADRSLKRQSIYRSIDGKKDQLIEKWLTTAHTSKKSTDKGSIERDWCCDSSLEEENPSIDSEVVFKDVKRKGLNMREAVAMYKSTESLNSIHSNVSYQTSMSKVKRVAAKKWT